MAFGATSLLTSAYDGPTMGWSSWNTFSVYISESLIMGQTDAMVATGLAEAGYKYINIDDGYQGGRNTDGSLKVHQERFPRGLKAVADYIHSKGLKAGIYSDAGALTCGSRAQDQHWCKDVGLYQHDAVDCNYFFNECGFDFIKVDYCGGVELGLKQKERYPEIAEAIRKYGREDVKLNICCWAYPGDWAHDVAVSWRTTGDIYDSWISVRDIIKENLYMSAYCYGGSYNDMDMLEVGRSMTAEEDKTHFGMWCIMSSPLLIGCNLQTINPTALQLLKNRELIALNQDPLGLQAYVVQHRDDTYVLVKDIENLYGATRAVALYNPSDKPALMTVSFGELALGGKVKVRDLFEHKDLGEMENAISAMVPAHGTRIYRLEAEQRVERYLYEAESAYMPCYQELENNEAIGTAIPVSSTGASGSMYAGWLGNRAENNLQWRDVYTVGGGDYTATFYCASMERRSMDVLVNGELAGTITAKTSDYSDFQPFTLDLHLKEGANNITLRNSTGWLPNVDCMYIDKVGENNIQKRQLGNIVEQLKAYRKAYALPAGMNGNIDALLQQVATTDDPAASITAVNAMLNTVKQVLPIMDKFNDWADATERAIAVSQQTEALAAFKEKYAASRRTLDEASSGITANKAVVAIRNAFKSYMRDADAMPIDGESFDMTMMIANHDFETASGWQDAPELRDGTAQQYDRSFNMYQDLGTMRPGIYTVTCNALFRIGDNDGGEAYKAGVEKIPAQLYANSDNVPVQSLYSYQWDEAGNYGTIDNSNGYAHSMYAAGLCFQKGAYLNTVKTELKEEGALRIGLRSIGTLPAHSWCCFNNFTLTFRPLPVVDGIETIVDGSDAGKAYYNIMGQPVSASAKGIVISKGRKLLKK